MTTLNSQMAEVLSGIRNEVSVDTDGKASITKKGLAELLGISRSVLGVDRMAKKLTETLTAKGFLGDDRSLSNGIPDVAVQCIIEYYAFDAQDKSEVALTLFRAFAAVGIRSWFQDLVGFEKPKPLSKLEGYREAQKAMEELITLMEYASNKPGLENIHNFALEADSTALPGLITVDDIMAQTDVTYTHRDRSVVGMFASTAYRNLTGRPPVKVKKQSVDKNGKSQTTYVPAYPLDFVPVIKNAIELGFSSCGDQVS